MCDVKRRLRRLCMLVLHLLRFIDSLWIQFIIRIFVWRQEIGNEINHELFECGRTTALVVWLDLFHLLLWAHLHPIDSEFMNMRGKKSLLNYENPLGTSSTNSTSNLNCIIVIYLHVSTLVHCTWIVWFDHQFIKPSMALCFSAKMFYIQSMASSFQCCIAVYSNKGSHHESISYLNKVLMTYRSKCTTFEMKAIHQNPSIR